MNMNDESHHGHIHARVPTNHNREEHLSNDQNHNVATAVANSRTDKASYANDADTSTSELYSQGVSALGVTREVGKPIRTS